MDQKSEGRLENEPVCTIGGTHPDDLVGQLSKSPLVDPWAMDPYEKDAEMPDLRAAGVRKIDFTKDKQGCVLSGLEKVAHDEDFDSMATYKKKRLNRESSYLGGHTGAISSAMQEKVEFAKKKADLSAEVSPPLPTKSILEQYKAAPEGTIRRTWADAAEKKELSSSGMPTYMQLIAEGKEEQYEQEMLKYCKLAGLKYVTTKEKMKKEVEAIKKGMRDAMSVMESRLNKLLDSFQQLDIDA